MKKIGIIVRSFEENGKWFVGCRKDVLDVLEDYSVNIILIPIYFSFEYIKSLLKLCDGVILTGGNKFHPNDFLLVQHLYNCDIPTLGICLGMQIMALSLGDGHEFDVSSIHQLKNNEVHNIYIKKGSLLYKIIGEDKISVNSRHYTGISSTNLNVCAVSEDNIIEAVEDPNKRFFLGLQWHPESLKDKKNDLIFQNFIKSLI